MLKYNAYIDNKRNTKVADKFYLFDILSPLFCYVRNPWLHYKQINAV